MRVTYTLCSTYPHILMSLSSGKEERKALNQERPNHWLSRFFFEFQTPNFGVSNSELSLNLQSNSRISEFPLRKFSSLSGRQIWGFFIRLCNGYREL